jgi:hypothetical protein
MFVKLKLNNPGKQKIPFTLGLITHLMIRIILKKNVYFIFELIKVKIREKEKRKS